MINITKRHRFVISSLFLSFGFVAIGLVDLSSRFYGIGGLALLTIILFYWSLREGLGANATLLTLTVPTLYTLGVGLFWFLLPSSVFARLPVVILYAVGIYVLLLTMNILTVSVVRTIALLRAARGVSFVLALFVSFLLYDAILSLKADLWVNVLLVVLSSFPLYLQGLWASKLDFQVAREVLVYSLVFTLGMGMVASILYFWPVTVVIGSLFLTVLMYVLLGMGQAQIEARLFRQVAREYLTVGVVVFVAMIFATHWRL